MLVIHYVKNLYQVYECSFFSGVVDNPHASFCACKSSFSVSSMSFCVPEIQSRAQKSVVLSFPVSSAMNKGKKTLVS